MTTPTSRPLPVVDDDETGGFWRAAAEHRLAVRQCGNCSAILHLPKSFCHHCESWDALWRDVSPRGSLYSWTVVRHAIHGAFPAPYTVVLVALDEFPDVRFVGHLPGTPDLSAGIPMHVRFEDVEPGVTIPQWEPTIQ